MSESHTFQPLRDLIDCCLPGEWGSDPIGDNANCAVFRATDIDSDGHLNVDGGALRAVLSGKLKSKLLKPHDILLEASGGAPDKPVGRVALVEGTLPQLSLTSNFFRFLRPSGKVDARFLLLQLVALNRSSAIWRYQQQTTGLINLKVEDYLNHEIWVPSLAVQRKIANIIFGIDVAIQKTEALIAKYRQIKAGLMHDLFTRGVLPNGQLRPPREQAPELYRETAIGWIPREWEVSKLRKYVRSTEYGISFSLSDSPPGIPVLRMNNIKDDKFDISDIKYCHESETYRLKLRYGDVLFNRTNSMEHVGKTAIWKNQLDECSFASYLVRINLDCARIIPEFFAYWMSREQSQNLIRRFATPAVQQVNINPTNLQKIDISVAKDLNEQKMIVGILQRQEALQEIEAAKLNKLKNQKLGLMQDLLTGKVPVQVDAPEAAHA